MGYLVGYNIGFIRGTCDRKNYDNYCSIKFPNFISNVCLKDYFAQYDGAVGKNDYADNVSIG